MPIDADVQAIIASIQKRMPERDPHACGYREALIIAVLRLTSTGEGVPLAWIATAVDEAVSEYRAVRRAGGAMTTDEIVEVLERWAEAITAADEALDLLLQAVGCDPESPLFTAVHALIGLADEWAGERIGAGGGWLEWYRLENDMGARAREAGFDGVVKPVRTLDDLAALLAEDVRRGDEMRPNA